MHLGGGVEVKPLIHFYCILYAKWWEGVQIAYVIDGRPLLTYMYKVLL